LLTKLKTLINSQKLNIDGEKLNDNRIIQHFHHNYITIFLVHMIIDKFSTFRNI